MKIEKVAFTGLNMSSSQSGNESKSRISNLLKRKQEISNFKQSYRENAMKQGKSQKEIEAKMQEYDSQIAEIDAEIAKINSDEQKKALQGGNKKQAKQSQDTNEVGKGNQANTQQMTAGFASMQKNLRLANSVQYAKSVLKTEALSYQPSFATQGNPVKAAKLSKRAESLDGKLNELQKKVSKSASQIDPDPKDKDKKEKTSSQY